MMYDYFHNTYHWIVFSIYLPLYLASYFITHKIFLKVFKSKYSSYSKEKKYYIVTNFCKSIVLTIISYLFLKKLYIDFDDMIILKNWGNANINNFIKNVTTLYSITDIASFISYKKMKNSTKFHHICVIISHITIVNSDLHYNSIQKAMIVYGLLSSYTALVNGYLALRFLIKFDTFFIKIIKNIYQSICFLNWTWQFWYVYFIKTNYYIILYLTFLYFWIKDDLMLLNFLLKEIKK